MQHQPLEGVRVLEFGGYISGPYASSLLCALGAEVVKVEPPGQGETFRRLENDKSLYFIQYNAGKRSLAVDLKRPEGVELVRSLIPKFDVVVENLRPGKLAALGLGPDECARLRPDVIYVSVTGFGNGGPLKDRPAYDMIGQSFGGLLSILSDADHAQLPGTCLGDLITGLSTAMGVMAALVGRERSGTGSVLETSLMEAVSTITIDAMTQSFEMRADPTRQSRHPQAVSFCLKTATGEDITIHLSSSERFWPRFCEALGRPEFADDARFATYAKRMENYFPLVEIVEGEFRTRSAAEWEKRLLEHDVPFAPVLTMSGYRSHPQVEWLDLIEPERDGVSLVRPPWKFSGTRPRRDGKAPRVGQDTRDLASEVYEADRIDKLMADGVLFVDTD